MNQPALLHLLEDFPYEVDFFQAVVALEQVFPEREPVGGYGAPSREVVRFVTRPTLSFPASEIQAFDVPEDGQPRLTVNFMGVAGALGPLPNTYTSLILERSRSRDHVLREFFDLFHHRLISLFYLAWEKYHFALAYRKPEKDRFTGYLMELVGLGIRELRNRQAVHDHALVYYAGLLGLQSRPAAALRQILWDHFDVPVRIEQFVGGWYKLDSDALCWLDGQETPSRRLGEGAVAGDAIWDHQARARIRLGPLSLSMYRRFLPGGGAWEQLRSLVMFFSGGQIDFEVQLVLARDQVPEYELGVDAGDGLPLGLCSWAGAGAFDHDPDDAILLLAE